MQRANPASFREAASRFATGVAVLTALDEHGRCLRHDREQLCHRQPVAADRAGVGHAGTHAPGDLGDGTLCVNVLPEHGRDLSRHFASQPSIGAARITTSSMACRAFRLHGLVRLRGDTRTSMSATTR